MLNDPGFREQMAEYFPDLLLMEEYSAAKERTYPVQVGSRRPEFGSHWKSCALQWTSIVP